MAYICVKMRFFRSKIVVFMEIIRTYRKKAKISQQEMANKLGIHIRTYQRRESGEVTLSELKDIAGILNLVVTITPKEGIM